jgi:hypothetical protein
MGFIPNPEIMAGRLLLSTQRCEAFTVRGSPKAPSTKPCETECGSRFRKETVATLIASGMVKSKVDFPKRKMGDRGTKP